MTQKEMTSQERYQEYFDAHTVINGNDAENAWDAQESHYASLREENAKLREVAESMAAALKDTDDQIYREDTVFRVKQTLHRWEKLKKDGE